MALTKMAKASKRVEQEVVSNRKVRRATASFGQNDIPDLQTDQKVYILQQKH